VYEDLLSPQSSSGELVTEDYKVGLFLCSFSVLLCGTVVFVFYSSRCVGEHTLTGGDPTNMSDIMLFACHSAAFVEPREWDDKITRGKGDPWSYISHLRLS
jgi:hypothetical protein